MIDLFRKQLREYKKMSISLNELEKMVVGTINSYEKFATVVLDLEQAGILSMVKSKGRSGRTPSLAYQYKIDKSLLVEDFHRELQKQRMLLHTAISLDFYFRKDPSYWSEDFPYLQKIDSYIRLYSLPTEQVAAPERSFEIVGDEKWIQEGNGKEILERIGLWEQFLIIPISDPLMLAVNSGMIHNRHQFHLIVENKTTY